MQITLSRPFAHPKILNADSPLDDAAGGRLGGEPRTKEANSKRNLGFQKTSIPRNRPLSLQAWLSS